jgi:hypothetical protein
MLGIFYTGNDDAPVTLGGNQANNFFAIRNRRLEAREGWKFFAYDNEHSLGVMRGVNDDRTGPVTAGQSREHFNPQWLHQKLMVHPEYRLLCADRAHEHLFNGGAMTPEKAIALCLTRANEIDLAIIAESARWGDQRPARANNPYTKADWWAEVNGYLVKTFFPVRTGIVLNQLRSRGLYPHVVAPVFQVNGTYRHGGHLAATDALSMTGGGTIWYTLDGSDPRLPGKAGSTAAAPTLVAATAPKRVLVPGRDIGETWKSGGPFDDSAWIPVTGAPGGVGYERGTGYQPLIGLDVGSHMYGSGKATSCYIRIPFDLTANLTLFTSLVLKVWYDDGFVAYLNGTEIQRAQFTGVPKWNSAAAGNHEVGAAESFDVSGRLPLLRRGPNLLALQGLNVSTSSSDFVILATLEAGQATGAQASGISPTALRYTGPVTLPKSARVKARALSGTTWSALNEAVFAVGPVAQGLRISELMYHPLDTGSPDDPNTEFIEITNIAGQSINLHLARFTEGIDYSFPSFDLPPGGYCLIVKDRAAFEARYGAELPVVGEYAGSLDNGGEGLELVDAAGQVVQSFRYEDDWHKKTDGQGFSLTIIDPKVTDIESLNAENAWRVSTQVGGSPGRTDL